MELLNQAGDLDDFLVSEFTIHSGEAGDRSGCQGSVRDGQAEAQAVCSRWSAP